MGVSWASINSQTIFFALKVYLEWVWACMCVCVWGCVCVCVREREKKKRERERGMNSCHKVWKHVERKSPPSTDRSFLPRALSWFLETFENGILNTVCSATIICKHYQDVLELCVILKWFLFLKETVLVARYINQRGIKGRKEKKTRIKLVRRVSGC